MLLLAHVGGFADHGHGLLPKRLRFVEQRLLLDKAPPSSSFQLLLRNA